jgi:hypothetical protein
MDRVTSKVSVEVTVRLEQGNRYSARASKSESINPAGPAPTIAQPVSRLSTDSSATDVNFADWAHIQFLKRLSQVA